MQVIANIFSYIYSNILIYIFPFLLFSFFFSTFFPFFFFFLTFQFFSFFDIPFFFFFFQVINIRHWNLKAFLELYTIIRFTSVYGFIYWIVTLTTYAAVKAVSKQFQDLPIKKPIPATRYYIAQVSCCSRLPLVSKNHELFPDIKSFLFSSSIIMGTTVFSSHRH